MTDSEKVSKARTVTESRVLTQDEFSKIKRAQLAKRVGIKEERRGTKRKIDTDESNILEKRYGLFVIVIGLSPNLGQEKMRLHINLHFQLKNISKVKDGVPG